jgi:hypothetical protein
MSLLNSLLFKLSGYLKIKMIKGELNQPYLERYMLFRWGKNGEHTLFLHRFLDSDSDQGVHDHPWNSLSFILSSGYNEERMIEKNGKKQLIVRDVKPFTFNRILKTDFHRIILKEKSPAWTLFYHGPRVKKWGFNHCKVSGEEIKEINYKEFSDPSNPLERWEDKASYGKYAKRQDVNYIFNK